ncbi:hypothetical protein CRUP_004623, partial [Coryphaenoides rupestris]
TEDSASGPLCCAEKLRAIKMELLYFPGFSLSHAEQYRWSFLTTPWLVFAIVLYEGLLGGAAYVNAFHFISKEAGDREREFSMAAASVADTLGIALAAVTAFPVHSYFCSM